MDDSSVNLEELESKLKNIQSIIGSSVNEKNIDILPMTADFIRKINGLRCTCCPTAKDRTSMSITWEQGRWISNW